MRLTSNSHYIFKTQRLISHFTATNKINQMQSETLIKYQSKEQNTN